MTQRRKRRTFTEDFKYQLVQLYNNGKPKSEILREYDIAPSGLDQWIRHINETGSTHEIDNRTPEQEELIRLLKQNQQLRMENDILKQAICGK